MGSRNVSDDDILDILGDAPLLRAPSPNQHARSTATEVADAPRIGTSHTETTSATRYVYKMVQIPQTIESSGSRDESGIAATYLQGVVNEYADDGWEFFRVDSIGVYNPPGCLLALLGHQGEQVNYYVVTFRKRVAATELV